MQNIYYVRLKDDGDWFDASAKDNRFFAFRTHAQAFADSLNAAEGAKDEEYKRESHARWAAKEALIQKIIDQTGIDVTPLIPGHSHTFEWRTEGLWSDHYDVVEAAVE